MKQISEHLGRIIVTLAGVALAIGIVVGFKGDIGGFFLNVISGETRIADAILGDMGGFDLDGDISGFRLVLEQDLSKKSSNPTAVDSISPLLSGKVVGSDGLVSLTVNGKTVTGQEDGSWSTYIPLSSGVLKEIQIVATDEAGQTIEETFYVVSCKSLTVTTSNRHKVGYTGQENERLVIPSVFYDEEDGLWYQVVQIGYSSDTVGAFQDCTNLAYVEIPDSVVAIGRYAFMGCTQLGEISFGDGVRTIYDSAFENCTSLTSVKIPDCVTMIDWCVFEGCTGLTDVTLPKDLTKVGVSAFKNCTSLKNISIPDSVMALEKSAFWGCSALESIVFGSASKLNEIEGSVFQNCGNLKRIAVPAGVTTIDSQAFYGCTGLTEVTFVGDSQLTSIGGNAFRNCAGLTEFVVPDGVTSIGNYGFGGCSQLAKISIAGSVTSIGHNAFNSCTGLREIVFGGSVDDWYNNVVTDVNWNYNVPTTVVVCRDGTVSLK